MRRLIWLIAILAVAGCQWWPHDTLNVGASALSVSEIEHDPALGSADFAVVPSEDGKFAIVASDARDLKGAFLELNYHPTLGHPRVEAAGALATPIALVEETAPGAAQLGIVLADYDSVKGINGTGTIATINFSEKEPADPRTTAAGVQTQVPVLGTRPYIDKANARLTWGIEFKGDYDQNGAVTISDLAPLGLHFREVGAPNTADTTVFSVIDGDDNGEINIADLSPIAVNYGKSLTGFEVFATADLLGEYPAQYVIRNVSVPAPLLTLPYANIQGNAATERCYLSATIGTTPLGTYYWLRPLLDGAPGDVTLTAIAGVWKDDMDSPAPPEYPTSVGLRYLPADSRIRIYQAIRGDGDRNGRYSIVDMTPIGALFFHEVDDVDYPSLNTDPPHDPRPWFADSDGDQVVTVGDLDLLFAWQQIEYDGLHLYIASEQDGPPTDPYAAYGTTLPHTDPQTPEDGVNAWLSYAVDLPSGSWIWARAMLEEFEGPVMDLQQIP